VRIVRVPLVPLAERPLRPPSSPPRSIGYLGSLERIKGVEPLLAAAPSLRELGLQLHVAGDGRLRPEVEAAPGVVYAGRVLGESKLRFVESVDVGVAPSIWEEANGPPYAVAEWLSAGRPALVSTRGGLAEAVSLPGVLGIEPTAAGIAEGSRRLLDAGEWERTLAARPPVEDRQDFERWLDDHEAVYSEARATS
jgi:glycosyltransferase involved in cell wall biosynthesis